MTSRQSEIPQSYQSALAQQQIEYVFKNVPTQLVANPLGAALAVWLLIDIEPWSKLLLWWSCIALAMAMRASIWIAYRRRQGAVLSPIRWGQLFALSNVFNGLAWGSLVYVFFSPEHLPESLGLIIAVAGFTAGSFSSHSAFLPAYVSFSACAIGLVTLRLLQEGTPTMNLVAGLCLLYFAVLVAYARTAQGQIKSAILTRFEVEALNRELTRQKNALEIAKRDAEQAVQSKNRFLASASHDLRQPLHALRLYTDYLEEEFRASPLRPLIANVSSTITGLEGMLSNLLDLARSDAQVLRPEIVPLPLGAALARLEAECAPLARQSGLKLRIRPSALWVMSDAVLLERILRNLLTNAIRYTPKGAVHVGARRRGESIRVELRDSGIGIAAEDAERIFEEFHQVANPERDRSKGLGLGLAIVDRLSRAVGAKVQLRSAPGRGSCFTLVIPTAEPQKSSQLAETDVTGIVVGFVDDDSEIRLAMEHILQAWGCVALIAENGDEILRLLDNEGVMPSILICDYRLRDGITGIDVIRRVRSHVEADVPALLLTGELGVEGLSDAQTAGIRVLHKPLQPARLREFIARTAWNDESPQ